MIDQPNRPAPSSPPDAIAKPKEGPRPSRASARKPRRPPTNLVEYYAEARANPAGLLTYLGQHGLFITHADDQRAAKESVVSLDPDLKKTRLLAQQVANSHSGRFVAAFYEFLVGCVDADLQGLRAWTPDDAMGARALLRELLVSRKASLAKARGLNLVLTVQAMMASRFELPLWDTLPLFAAAFRPSNRPRRPPAALGYPALSGPVLRFWLELLGPWMDRARDDARRAQRAEGEERALLTRVDALEARVAELTKDRDGLAAELRETTEELRSTRLAMQVDLSQLRDSMAGFLTEDVVGYLRAAEEGLGLDPPRVPHALERIDDLHHAIEHKVSWLKSSG